VPIGLKGNTDGSGAIQIGGSDAISISTGLNTTFAGTITATGTVAGTTGTLYPLVSGTAVASTSGTAIDFTGIPSWAKRVTVMFSGVSTNGAAGFSIQLGTSGGIVSSGYIGGVSVGTTYNSNSSSFFIYSSSSAPDSVSGNIMLALIGSNTWAESGNLTQAANGATRLSGGSVGLSGVLTTVRIITANGTDTFDAGSINILYE